MSLEPVWPSRLRHDLHELTVQTSKTLNLTDLTRLEVFGVDVRTYRGVNYETIQAIAAAAHFLEYDGLLVPSARYDGTNLVIFPDRLPPNGTVVSVGSEPVDWDAWRRR
jgi:hypothetical protein